MSSPASSRSSSRSAGPFIASPIPFSPPRPAPAPSSRPHHHQRKSSSDHDTLHISLRAQKGKGGRAPLSPVRSIASTSSQAPLLSPRHRPYPSSPRRIPTCDSGSSWAPPNNWDSELEREAMARGGGKKGKDGKQRKEYSPEKRERILEHHRRIVEACKILGL